MLGHFWFPMVSCCEADSVAFYFSVVILIHIGGKSAFLFSGCLLFTNSQPEYASTTNARNEQWTGARKQPDLHDEHAWKPSLHDQWHDPSLQWKSGTAVCAEPQWPIHGQCSSLFSVCVLYLLFYWHNLKRKEIQSACPESNNGVNYNSYLAFK